MSTAVSKPWPDASLAGQRTLVQFDGTYLSALRSSLGFALDFRALRHALDQATRLLRAVYYDELLDGDDNRRRLTDWLEYNGFSVSIRTCRQDGIPVGSYVAMAVDAIGHLPQYTHLVLFAGSDALLPMVRAVRNSGPQVTVIGTLRMGPAEVSDKIRRSADHFIDAVQLQHLSLQPKSAPAMQQAAPGAASA